MAIPRVDITSEINDWQNAIYGEEVRSANVSALTKLQTQINAASDEIEDELEIIEGAVNTANAASTAANTAVSTATQAVSDAQDAIDQANAAIASAQGYAQDASDSADAAAAVVVTVNNTAARAEAAEQGAITAQHAAEAAVPADYSELVAAVERVEENEAAQTAAIGVNAADIVKLNGIVSNQNLLDNPFFQIAQAGYGGMHGSSKYAADRWVLYENLGSFADNGNKTFTLSGDARLMFQRLSVMEDGNVYTLSLMLSDGTVKALTVNSNDSYKYTDIGNGWVLSFEKVSAIRQFEIRHSTGSSALTIKAVKLEYGTVSTLANDSVPNEATELMKCRWYYRQLYLPDYNDVSRIDSNSMTAYVKLTGSMRTIPTVQLKLLQVKSNGSDVSGFTFSTSYAFNTFDSVGFYLVCSKANHGLTYANYPSVSLSAELSADL